MAEPHPRGRLVIARHEARYRLASDHPDPAGARGRLDRLAAEALPSRLATLLRGVLDTDDPTLWMIRRLDLDLTVDLGAQGDGRLADGWAGAFGRQLVHLIRRGPDGRNVLRFTDREEYLAELVAAILDGSAWNNWIFESYRDLRHLPESAALAEALAGMGERLFVVLSRLAHQGRLPALRRALRPRDAGRVARLALAAREEAQAPSWPGLESALSLVARLTPGERREPETARFALLVAAWEAAPGAAPRGEVLDALDLASRLLVASRHDSIVRDALDLATLAPDDLIVRLAEGGERQLAATVAGLDGLPHGTGRDAMDQDAEPDLTETGPLGPGASPVATPTIRELGWIEAGSTGAFLLLRSWLALDLDGWLAGAGIDAAARPPLRALTFAKALGGATALRRVGEPAVRWAAGLDEEPSASTVADAAFASLESRRLVSLARRWPGHLIERGRADGRILGLERIALPGPAGTTRAELLVRDGVRDDWLALESAAWLALDEEAADPRTAQRVDQLADRLVADRLVADRLVADRLVEVPTGAGEPRAADSMAGRGAPSPTFVIDAELPALAEALLARGAAVFVREDGRRGGEARVGASPWPLNASTAQTDACLGSEGDGSPDEQSPGPAPADGGDDPAGAAFLAARRDAADGLGFLTLGPPLEPREGGEPPTPDQLLSLVSHALLRDLAGRLVGFAGSGDRFVAERFLRGSGRMRQTAEALEVELPEVSLGVVLRMSGADGRSFEAPWIPVPIQLWMPR